MIAWKSYLNRGGRTRSTYIAARGMTASLGAESSVGNCYQSVGALRIFCDSLFGERFQ